MKTDCFIQQIRRFKHGFSQDRLAQIGTICGGYVKIFCENPGYCDKPQRLLKEARRSAESRVLVAVGERSVTHGK